MAQRPLNLQQLIRDPAKVWLQRLEAYSLQVAELVDQADGDPSSAAGKRACELACEQLATALAKAGRL